MPHSLLLTLLSSSMSASRRSVKVVKSGKPLSFCFITSTGGMSPAGSL